MKNEAKSFNEMSNPELKNSKPWAEENYKIWYAEMGKRGLLKNYENEYEQFIRTGHAAKILGISKTSLINKLKSGEIIGKKIKLKREEWRITLDEIERIKSIISNNL